MFGVHFLICLCICTYRCFKYIFYYVKMESLFLFFNDSLYRRIAVPLKWWTLQLSSVHQHWCIVATCWGILIGSARCLLSKNHTVALNDESKPTNTKVSSFWHSVRSLKTSFSHIWARNSELSCVFVICIWTASASADIWTCSRE